MGLLKRLFSYKIDKQNKKSIKSVASQSVPQNENLSKLFKCGDYINSLLNHLIFHNNFNHDILNILKNEI